MLGHPDAAYDLPPETQARLLGWMTARATLTGPKPAAAHKPAGNVDLSFANFGGRR